MAVDIMGPEGEAAEMKNPGSAGKTKKPAAETPSDLVTLLSQKVIGQPAAMKYIVPYVEMFQAGLSPEGRPAGVFLLLGPTGTGKTKTVEALAEVMHGSEKNVLKVDCGEYQMEHEVAKLIGAPPGYLGHRETQPMLTQQKLNAVTSEKSNLAIVLFDEIEKAAPSMVRLLLGVLDRANLRLGDNTSVNFENSLIFLTSNLGAREMMKELHPNSASRLPGPPCANSRTCSASWRASRSVRYGRSSRRSLSTASTQSSPTSRSTRSRFRLFSISR